MLCIKNILQFFFIYSVMMHSSTIVFNLVDDLSATLKNFV